jgi:hypothetical protein
MNFYSNLGGDSNVNSFDIGAEHIKVQFNNSPVYVYTYQSAGTQNIEAMKLLAVAGHGLNGYIQRHVRKSYSHIE